MCAFHEDDASRVSSIYKCSILAVVQILKQLFFRYYRNRYDIPKVFTFVLYEIELYNITTNHSFCLILHQIFFNCFGFLPFGIKLQSSSYLVAPLKVGNVYFSTLDHTCCLKISFNCVNYLYIPLSVCVSENIQIM